MKKFKNILSWFIINGVISALAIFGIIYGVDWAYNIFRFIMWLITLIYIIGAFGVVEGDENINKAVRPVPSFISTTYYLPLMLFLAGHGIFLYAILQFIHLYCYEFIYRTIEQ